MVPVITAPAKPRVALPTSGGPPRPSYSVIVVGSLALAGLSLLVLPRGIAYDPWSWLVWGREIIHLRLNTRDAATSVKPLPMLVTTLVAPAGGAAPLLWLVVARAGAIAAVGLAWRLADRLGGAVAGWIAAFGLVTSFEFASYLFFAGMSEPMAAATGLAAADFTLQRRYQAAGVAFLLTALLRLEAWPFLIAFLGWRLLCRFSLRRLAGAAGLVLLLPLAWFGVDWLGSRQLMRSAGAASQQSQGGPLLSPHPGLATVAETVHQLVAPVAIGFVLTAIVAVVVAWWRRDRLAGELAALSAAAVAWLLIVAAMAQVRIATGAPRYLLPAVALAVVVGAVGIRRASGLVLERGPASRMGIGVAVAGLLMAAVVGGSVPQSVVVGQRVSGELVTDRQLQQRAEAMSTVTKQAGRRRLLRCGQLVTSPFQVPTLAWAERLPLGRLSAHPQPNGTVVEVGDLPVIPAGLRARYHRVTSAGPPGARLQVLTTC